MPSHGKGEVHEQGLYCPRASEGSFSSVYLFVLRTFERIHFTLQSLHLFGRVFGARFSLGHANTAITIMRRERETQVCEEQGRRKTNPNHNSFSDRIGYLRRIRLPSADRIVQQRRDLIAVPPSSIVRWCRWAGALAEKTITYIF